MSKITDFCIAECERQNDLNTESVSGMVEAYITAQFLFGLGVNPNINTILEMAEMIKPQNKKGFRQTSVTFSNGNQGIQYSLIPDAMDKLVNAIEDISAQEFYIEFEKIHPFEDGNGRLGTILYNGLNGTINNPVVPAFAFTSNDE